MKPAAVTVPATAEFVRVAAKFVVETSRHLGIASATSPLFEVAVVEALANAVKHGSRGRSEAVVTCEVERTDDGLTVRVFDEGDGFEPPVWKSAPIDPASLETSALPESGYGMSIIRSVFQEIDGHREGDRFCLELRLAAELPLP
jgi:anti-sigma regulatory factor (Ser/Thr protein kinase)